MTAQAAASPALDALELTVVVDNETDTLSSVDPGVDQVPEMLSLLGRLPQSREHEWQPGFCVFDQLCVACHGFSVLVRGRLGTQARTVLFDVGPYADVWLDNSERIGIDLEAIESAGGEVVLNADAHLVADLFAGSGLIERTTQYETGLDGHSTFHGDDCHDDPMILDERFLAAQVKGRGVSVLSACSHAGVVNACLGARALFGGERIDTVLGGYHLAGGAMEDRIEPTVRDLVEVVGPRLVAPGHCTGWRAKAALADTFAPGSYGPSVVGTRYTLAARE